MANVDHPSLLRAVPMAHAFGNLSVAHAKYTVDLAQNDTLDMIRLPKGTVIVDSMLIVSALGSSVTLDLGIQAVDAGAKSDDDSLNAAADGSAAVIIRRTRAAVNSDSAMDLDDDDYDVRITAEGANPASGTYELFVFYYFKGTK